MRARPVVLRRLVLGIVLGVLALAVPLGAAVPRAGAATIDVPVPPAIDGTGRTDVTQILTAFLQRLPRGAVVGFPNDGRYRIEGTVVLSNARDVVIDGHGATFFATTDGSDVLPGPGGGPRAHWPRLRAQWRIRGGSGITLRDMKIRGANPKGGATPDAFVPDLEGQAGIAVQRAAGVTIDGVQISDTYGDGVWITGNSRAVTIRNSTIERIGRQGVAVVSGRQVVVEGNHLRGISRSVFDLEPAGRAAVQDVQLRDNDVGDYGNFLLAAGGGGPGVNDVVLEGNRVDGGHGVSVYAGIPTQRRAGYRIVGNRGTGSVRPVPGTDRPGLIQLANLDRVEIRGNRQRVDGVPAISLDRVCDVAVAGNEFPGADPVQQEVAPCGAAAPVPSSRGPGPTAAPPTTSAPAPVDSDSGGGTSALTVALLLGAGFVVGIAVAFAVFQAGRRGRIGSGP